MRWLLIMELTKGSTIKLTNGTEVTVLNLPTSFMANGSYEIMAGDGNKRWVKPEEMVGSLK